MAGWVIHGPHCDAMGCVTLWCWPCIHNRDKFLINLNRLFLNVKCANTQPLLECGLCFFFQISRRKAFWQNRLQIWNWAERWRSIRTKFILINSSRYRILDERRKMTFGLFTYFLLSSSLAVLFLSRLCFVFVSSLSSAFHRVIQCSHIFRFFSLFFFSFCRFLAGSVHTVAPFRYFYFVDVMFNILNWNIVDANVHSAPFFRWLLDYNYRFVFFLSPPFEIDFRHLVIYNVQLLTILEGIICNLDLIDRIFQFGLAECWRSCSVWSVSLHEWSANGWLISNVSKGDDVWLKLTFKRCYWR